MMLFNPTNEDFGDMMFGGRGYPIAAGGKLKVDDSCGKHLLNAYGARGLCSLEYGDDEAVIADGGRKRNLDFKKSHVNQHNQSNLARRQQGLPYREPSAILKKYAEELHLVLEEPYAPQAGKMDDGRLATLESTVNSLSKMMEMMMSKMIVEEAPAPNKVPPKKEK